MRTLLIFLCLAIAIVLATASTSRGDDPEPLDETDDTTEPITGEPFTPQPGSEQQRKDPFALYDIGGPESAWPYDTLTAAEKIVVDRGRTDTQDQVNAAFAAASAGIAKEAKAQAAAIELGMQTSPGEIGVVP